MPRIHNFNAGPAALPLPVLETVQRELLDYDGTGMSIMEHSHRGKAFDAVHNDAIARLKRLLGIGDAHEVLFLQGGASLQFVMMPHNFVGAEQSADYVVTGTWTKKALAECQRVARGRAAADVHDADGRCTRIPRSEELEFDPTARYVHITSNNTIFGTQYHAWPDTGAVPIIADMSSDFLWRRHDLEGIDMAFAGAQKNVGPSGVCIVVAKKSFLATAKTEGVANILSYAVEAEKNSLYNTPNTFGIYVVRAVLAHLEERGGLEAVERENRAQAALVYETIDADPDFFRAPVARDDRSVMNVVFRLPSEDLEARFLAAAAERRLAGLKGHRSVGGIRASIYNAAPRAAVEALVAFMTEFRRTA
ncbi:MAG: 3-phosphoserine/phosphohydroxythreonine transaminase [Myxococcota bacterium]